MGWWKWRSIFEHLSITTLGNASCGLIYIATLLQLYSSCIWNKQWLYLYSHALYVFTKVPAINLSVNFIVVSLQFSIPRGQILSHSCAIAHIPLPTKHFAATRSTVNTQDVQLHICTRSDRSGVRAKVSPFFPSYEGGLRSLAYLRWQDPYRNILLSLT